MMLVIGPPNRNPRLSAKNASNNDAIGRVHAVTIKHDTNLRAEFDGKSKVGSTAATSQSMKPFMMPSRCDIRQAFIVPGN